VVDAERKFWDFDFGWVRSCHDWFVFQRSNLGKNVIHNKYLAYKLIGDGAYPIRPSFHSQSSTRMVIERAFGCLKGKWRILLKGIDVPLENLRDLVTTYICLHNLYIIHGDDLINMCWVTTRS